jgi:hypothetical protein
LQLHAATVTVSTTNDAGPGSLRDALASAKDGDTIDASGVAGTITLTGGELLVTNSVNIIGSGPFNLAVDGNFPNTTNRVFHIGPSNAVSISSLTITNGHATDEPTRGGGIYNDHATLTVSNCTLSGNLSGTGGGIDNDGGFSGSATLTVIASSLSSNSARFGGGIYNDGGFSGSATLTVIASTLSGNSAEVGGGIYSIGEVSGRATVQIARSTVCSNFTVDVFGIGGGIYNDGAYGSATLTVSNCTLSGNSANVGGGIYNDGFLGSATLTIIASTVCSNSAFGGGGIRNEGFNGSATVEIVNSTLSGNSAGEGGGISTGGNSAFTSVKIANSTLSGNSASLSGGGIFNAIYSGSATVQIVNSTLCGNSASGGGGGGIYNIASFGSAIVEIGSTILNAGSLGGNIVTEQSGAVTSLGYNLSSDDGGGFLTATGDRINTDPRLGPLHDNGGPTFTHTLLCGSPAIDQGKNFSTSSTDQRGDGFARIVDNPAVPNATGGDGTDIGAFEVQQGVCDSLAEQVGDLIALVRGLGLPSGTAKSLTVKLQAAANALDRGNTQVACGCLGAFLNEVNAQNGKKLPTAQADLLIAEAVRIRAVTGC